MVSDLHNLTPQNRLATAVHSSTTGHLPQVTSALYSGARMQYTKSNAEGAAQISEVLVQKIQVQAVHAGEISTNTQPYGSQTSRPPGRRLLTFQFSVCCHKLCRSNQRSHLSADDAQLIQQAGESPAAITRASAPAWGSASKSPSGRHSANLVQQAGELPAAVTRAAHLRRSGKSPSGVPLSQRRHCSVPTSFDACRDPEHVDLPAGGSGITGTRRS
jgi:hypothetical protein